MASTTVDGLRITGEWNGTRLQATSEITSFLKFGASNTHLERGAKISNLTFGGGNNADRFLWFNSANQTYVGHVAGRNLNESMIFAKPTGGRPNYDSALYEKVFILNAGALAIHEAGGGNCADIKISRCSANRPNTYGLILRDPVRHEIQRFYSGWGQGEAKGAVLIENTPQENNTRAPRGARQNRLHAVAHENLANTPKDSATIHIKSLPGANGENYSHELYYPRAHQPAAQQILRVEGTPENPVTDVHLHGLQYIPKHEEAIELRHAEDCTLEYNIKGRFGDAAKTPPQGVVTENCRRIQYNGVGYNQGNPNSEGVWQDNGSEGVTVVDRANGVLYRRADQHWWPIVSRND
jgi:hypothetical protein